MPRPRTRLISLLAAAGSLLCPGSARAEEGNPPPAPGAGAATEEVKEVGAPREGTRALTAEEKAERLDAVESELARDMGGMKSLRASFVQRKRLEVFEEEVESRGTLALAVPDRLRWEVSSPVKSVLVVNGDRAMRVRTSRRGVRTETRFPLADDPVAAGTARQILLWMTGDLGTARKEYDLELLEDAPLRVRAVPRSPELARVVVAVEIRFSEDRKSVLEVILEEAAKAKTVITFSGVERDPHLAKDLFEIGK